MPPGTQPDCFHATDKHLWRDCLNNAASLYQVDLSGGLAGSVRAGSGSDMSAESVVGVEPGRSSVNNPRQSTLGPANTVYRQIPYQITPSLDWSPIPNLRVLGFEVAAPAAGDLCWHLRSRGAGLEWIGF
jgi:hypothetical protein